MRIIDISLAISNNIPVWPGDRGVKLERISSIEEGANSNDSRIELGVHTGTHIDAPVHFGMSAKDVTGIRLDELIGPCLVIEIPENITIITKEVIGQMQIPASPTRLLFKTRNSKIWDQDTSDFDTNYVGIDEEAAKILVDRGTRVVGIDYLSVAPFKKTRPTHEVLLGADIVLLEGLDLRKVSTGYYTLICLPLKLAGSDGAPARIVLIDEV